MAALLVAGSHQSPVTQVAPQQPPLELPLAHDLLPGPDSSGTLAAQSHDVDGPAGQTNPAAEMERSLIFMSVTESAHHKRVSLEITERKLKHDNY